ncbi:Cof-type HAD-IIB family hydrolase [Neisseriaceae bacterium TC5R-5]|nr:Cof-type HAD-IIB family hydrolase [Neisseriaceae bacterium TC5R-5]
MAYQFIASDLDGTLLNPSHAVDTFTASTLQALAARGLQFAIATGRHHLDVMGIRQALGIPAYLITSNGARVHDPQDTLIHAQDIPPSLVQQLAQPHFAAGTVLNFYRNEDWLIDQPCQYLLDFHADSELSYHVTDLSRHSGAGVAKVLYIAEHEHLLQVERKLHASFADELYITFSAEDCLEVMASGVSKGQALQLVLQRLDIASEHCLAFGDGQNDLSLLQLVGHPRMMANAHPRLAEQLPQVPRIGSNQQAGVAHYLRELFAL